MSKRTKEALVRCHALTYGNFTLASGAKSPYYIDIKRASTDPSVLEVIADEMAREIQASAISYEKIAGVVLGSIPLAVALSLRTKSPYIMVRKETKDHGMKRAIEGQLLLGDKVLMAEDVITTAGSVAAAIEQVRVAGGEVVGVLAVVDRQQGGREKLQSMGVPLWSLVTAEEILGG